MGKAVTIDVLANDSNSSGGSLTLSLPRPPQHGSVTIDNNGTPGNPSDDRIVYTPDSRFIGTESFSYTLTNSAGATATGIVAVTIDGSGNRPPNDLFLSTLAVSQSSAAGLTLATISGSDPNNDSVTFSLVNDASGRFAISGNRLVSTSTALSPTDISHRITIRATDPSGATYDEDVRVFVIDSPSDGLLSQAAIEPPIGGQIHGDIASENSGRKLTVIGDINGDGFDDIAIGARDADFNGLTDAGKAYVVFGTSSGFASPLNLSTLDGTNGFSISGVATNDQLGRGLAGGDVNGDGLADLIVSQPGTTNNAGKVHVIFGKTSAFAATFDITSINGSNGVTIQSMPSNSGSLGQDVAAGDINGDGLQDVVIRSAGDVYVVFGRTSFPSATVTSLAGGVAGFRFDNTNVDNLGTPEDVNGDGLDDLVLGNISSSGEAWVFFGATSFATETPTFSFSAPNTSAGFRMTATGSTRFGTVGSVGDVNGDGFAYIGIGDYNADANKGRSYVFFGSATPAASNVDLSTLNGSTGFSITNNSGPTAILGESIGTAGDINGDGFDDVIIGGTDTAYDQRVAVIFGGSSFGASIDLSTLNGSNGFVIDGGNFYSNFGASLAAGDINGDGFDDAVIAARTDDGNELHDSGITYVIYGADFGGNRVTHLGDSDANTITGTSGSNAIVAGRGSDAIIGLGGADSFRAGQGDDQIEISDLTFQRIVGGAGNDTLRLNNVSGLNFDLSTVRDNRLLGIETIDLRSGGADTLTLSVRDVLNLSNTSNTLLVQRSSTDAVAKGTGWTQQVDEAINGVLYNVFVQGNATLKVQAALGTLKVQAALGTLSATFTTGVLTIQDSVGRNNQLTLTVSGSNLVVQDANEQFIAAPSGTTISLDGHSLTVPLTSLTGDVIFNTGDGADSVTAVGSIVANSNRVAVSLGNGNDQANFSTTSLQTTLNGGAGSDTLIGSQSQDSMDGGSGDDALTGNLGDDILNGVGNVDTLLEIADADMTLTATQLIVVINARTPSAVTHMDTLSGLEAANLLGGSNANILTAASASFGVTLRGATGDDTLTGSSQADRLEGGGSNDVLSGGLGNDVLIGGTGTDLVREVADVNFTITNDVSFDGALTGGLGSDTLTSIENADLTGGVSSNRIDASGFVGIGFTQLNAGGNGSDTLIGSKGADIISGALGADCITGGAGNDFLYGGGGRDTLDGGPGSDRVFGQGASGDVVRGGADDDTVSGGTGNDSVLGEDGNDRVVGEDGNDTLLGGTGNDSLFGDAGVDSLLGEAGNDLISGGADSDALLDGGADTDRVSEIGNTNFTILGLQLSSALTGVETALNVERFDLSSQGNSNRLDGSGSAVRVILNGNGGADTLIGSPFNDSLFGGDGDDVLQGNAGVDLIDGGLGSDYQYEKADTNFTVSGATVSSAVTGSDLAPNSVERIALVGGASANQLNASAATVPVVLVGGLGNDTLLGGSQSDTLSGGNRGDSGVSGADGTDSLNGGAGSDLYESDSSDTLVIDVGDTTLADVFAALPTWIDAL